MAFWKALWSLLWFGGLGLFAYLSAIITWQGARDLRALLQSLRSDPSRAETQGTAPPAVAEDRPTAP